MPHFCLEAPTIGITPTQHYYLPSLTPTINLLRPRTYNPYFPVFPHFSAGKMVSAMSHRLIDTIQGNPGSATRFNMKKRYFEEHINGYCFVATVCSSYPRRLTPDSNCSFVRLFSAITIRMDDDSSMFIARDP